jgi:hypothetical protein
MRTIKMLLGIILVPGCLMLPAQSRLAQAQGIPHDWSHEHVIFSKPSSPEALEILEQEPRYQMQQAWRERLALLGDSAAAFDAEALQTVIRKPRLKRDWSATIGDDTATIGNGMFPAKFSFGNTANCANATNPDYVAFNTRSTGSATVATIIAFDNLYGSGLCTGTVPTVYWAYDTSALSRLQWCSPTTPAVPVGVYRYRIVHWPAGEPQHLEMEGRPGNRRYHAGDSRHCYYPPCHLRHLQRRQHFLSAAPELRRRRRRH